MIYSKCISLLFTTGTSYTCDCTKTGYKGTICQESVAECEQNDPYMCDQTGSSKCEELENGYNCVCKPGYIKTQQDMYGRISWGVQIVSKGIVTACYTLLLYISWVTNPQPA
jgi:hypothetical protein